MLKKTILKNLDKEFCENYSALLDAIEVMRDYDAESEEIKEHIRYVVEQIGSSITKERFTYYRESQKALFYEADDGYRLGRFNVLLDRAFQQFPKNREFMLVAENLGQEHARLRGIHSLQSLGIFVNAF